MEPALHSCASVCVYTSVCICVCGCVSVQLIKSLAGITVDELLAFELLWTPQVKLTTMHVSCFTQPLLLAYWLLVLQANASWQ